VEVASTVTEKSQAKEEFIGDALRAVGGAIKNVLGIGGKGGNPNDPADENEMPLKPTPSSFAPDPRRHGTFPGNDNYRRAVYGLRRRRMPYTTSRTFGSLNPYRRPNDWHKNAMDCMFPRDRFYMATHPDLTDFGKEGPSGVFPYGDYSSFSRSHSLIPGRSDWRLRGRAMLGDLGGTVNMPFAPMSPHHAHAAFYSPQPSAPNTVVIVGGGGGGGWGGPGMGWGGGGMGWGGGGSGWGGHEMGPGMGWGGGGGGDGGQHKGGSKFDGQKFAAKGGKIGAGPAGPSDVKGGKAPHQDAGAPPQAAGAPPQAAGAPPQAAGAPPPLAAPPGQDAGAGGAPPAAPGADAAAAPPPAS